MASIAHLAAGAACGAVYARRTKQPPVRPMVAFAALALASDLDLLFLGLHPDGTPLEHRVMTHAIPFGLFLGPLIGALIGGRGFRRTSAFFGALALSSHGVIDAFTRAGKAPVLFWPFSWARVWSPWRPIPGMESYQEYFALDSIWVYLREGVICVPFLLIAAWALFAPSRSRASTTPIKDPAADAV